MVAVNVDWPIEAANGFGEFIHSTTWHSVIPMWKMDIAEPILAGGVYIGLHPIDTNDGLDAQRTKFLECLFTLWQTTGNHLGMHQHRIWQVRRCDFPWRLIALVPYLLCCPFVLVVGNVRRGWRTADRQQYEQQQESRNDHGFLGIHGAALRHYVFGDCKMFTACVSTRNQRDAVIYWQKADS